MRKVFRGLALLAALPALCVVGFAIAMPLAEPGFEPVDPTAPPRYLAVLAAWDTEGGGFACRAFYWTDVIDHRAELPTLRFDVTPEELNLCEARFRSFSRDGRWSHQFDWDASSFRATVSRPDGDRPDVLEVDYPPEDDYVADTRYRIDAASGEPADFEFRGYFGLAYFMGAFMMGAGLGFLLWLGLAAWLAMRWARQAREERQGEPEGAA